MQIQQKKQQTIKKKLNKHYIFNDSNDLADTLLLRVLIKDVIQKLSNESLKVIIKIKITNITTSHINSEFIIYFVIYNKHILFI